MDLISTLLPHTIPLSLSRRVLFALCLITPQKNESFERNNFQFYRVELKIDKILETTL